MNQTTFVIVITLFFIWLIGLSIVLAHMVLRYQRLTAGIKSKELRELLEDANRRLEEQKKVTEEIQKWIKLLEKDAESHIQKIGFIRFNPFTDTGGNQSFCLALLDKQNNGIIISSLHSREQTRTYAKAIKNGKTEGLELSKEEKETLNKAKSSH